MQKEMKTFSTLFVAAGLAMASISFAQENNGFSLRTRAISDAFSRATPMDIFVTGVNQSTVQYKTDPTHAASESLPLAQFKFFYMFEPEDFLSAKESFQNDQFREARAKFSKVKARLAPIMGLEDGYFQAAALLEIDAALSLLDWAAVKELTAAFPRQSPLTEEMKLDMAIYDLFGKLADQAYDQIISSATTLLAGKDKLSLDQTARLHYLMGVAQEQKNNASEAIDDLALSIVGAHGGNRELAASAIQHSLDIYMKNPKLADLLKKVNLGEVDASRAGNVPQEVKDAAALVYLYKNVLFPDRVLNPKFDWLLKFYKSPAASAKDKDAAALVKEAEKKDAPAAPAPAPAPPAPAPAKK